MKLILVVAVLAACLNQLVAAKGTPPPAPYGGKGPQGRPPGPPQGRPNGPGGPGGPQGGPRKGGDGLIGIQILVQRVDAAHLAVGQAGAMLSSVLGRLALSKPRASWPDIELALRAGGVSDSVISKVQQIAQQLIGVGSPKKAKKNVVDKAVQSVDKIIKLVAGILADVLKQLADFLKQYMPQIASTIVTFLTSLLPPIIDALVQCAPQIIQLIGMLIAECPRDAQVNNGTTNATDPNQGGAYVPEAPSVPVPSVPYVPPVQTKKTKIIKSRVFVPE